MDLKKEIKLSDLVKRPKRAKKPAPALQGSNGKQARSRPRKTKGELVGIKIGATQLAASRVANNGSPHVLQLAREDLPAGVVAGGEVRSVPALAKALDEFFTKHALPRRGVRLGVATNRIGVRAFEVAGIDDDAQLANAVRFRAHEAVGIPLDQAVLDYKVLSESVDGAGKRSRRILVVAAYRESIDRYTDAFKQAGIELAGIDLEAFGLLRAVAAPAERPEGGEAALVAVTIGHERTTLAISDGAVCDFTRVLEWGGSTLTGAIERQLNISAAEAAELKLGLSLEASASLDAMARRQSRAGPRGGAARAPDACARARRLAAVLPGPARLARDRRDLGFRRHQPDAGPARRARAPDARSGSPGRPARPGEGRGFGCCG